MYFSLFVIGCHHDWKLKPDVRTGLLFQPLEKHVKRQHFEFPCLGEKILLWVPLKQTETRISKQVVYLRSKAKSEKTPGE